MIMTFKRILLWTVSSAACVLSFIVVSRCLRDGQGSRQFAGSARRSVTMLAFGDVNLGRLVGQRILSDEIDYPFENISLKPIGSDIVFGNLESQISDQGGETQDPVHNMVFTGPPNGAHALVKFGFTIVSTANNHAFDYGKDALFETLDHLDEENIGHVGTSRTEGGIYEPLMVERNGIRFALFAVTDLMNFSGGWHQYVPMTDTSRLFPSIRRAAAAVDVVVLSVHGGDEYGEKPSHHIREFDEQCIRQGVTVVLGHHPHVPYGIERVGKSYIVYSMGNFVFYQPQLFWTQLGFAVRFTFERNDSTVSVSALECIPLRAGYQPSVLTDSSALFQLQQRLQSLSNIPITLTNKGYLN